MGVVERFNSKEFVPGVPVAPTVVGQRVRTVSRSRTVPAYMETGTVVRFTRAGNAVVLADACGGEPERQVVDYESCFRVVGDDGRFVRA
jgi:hypothetical protein